MDSEPSGFGFVCGKCKKKFRKPVLADRCCVEQSLRKGKVY